MSTSIQVSNGYMKYDIIHAVIFILEISRVIRHPELPTITNSVSMVT